MICDRLALSVFQSDQPLLRYGIIKKEYAWEEWKFRPKDGQLAMFIVTIKVRADIKLQFKPKIVKIGPVVIEKS